MKQYIHNVPGRLRIKTTLIKRNEEMAIHTRKFINQIRGINSASTNTITGSITILYNTKIIKANMILATLKDAGFISKPQITPHVNETLSRVGKFVGKFIFGLAVEKALGRNFLSFVITALILF